MSSRYLSIDIAHTSSSDSILSDLTHVDDEYYRKEITNPTKLSNAYLNYEHLKNFIAHIKGLNIEITTGQKNVIINWIKNLENDETDNVLMSITIDMDNGTRLDLLGVCDINEKTFHVLFKDLVAKTNIIYNDYTLIAFISENQIYLCIRHNEADQTFEIREGSIITSNLENTEFFYTKEINAIVEMKRELLECFGSKFTLRIIPLNVHSFQNLETNEDAFKKYSFEFKCETEWPIKYPEFGVLNRDITTNTSSLLQTYNVDNETFKISHNNCQVIKLNHANVFEYLFFIFIRNEIKIFKCDYIKYGMFSKNGNLFGGLHKENDHFYIWDIETLKMAKRYKKNDFGNIYIGDLWKLPDASIKLPIEKENVLIFELIYQNENSEIMVLYQNYSLSFYRKDNNINKYTRIFHITLPINQIENFVYDDRYYLTICEKTEHEYRLIRFNYKYKVIDMIYQLPYKYGTNLICIGKDKIIFNEKEDYKLSIMSNCSKIYYDEFHSENPMAIFKDSRNYDYIMYKIYHRTEKTEYDDYFDVGLASPKGIFRYLSGYENVAFSYDGKHIACINANTKDVHFYEVLNDLNIRELNAPLNYIDFLKECSIEIDFRCDFALSYKDDKFYKRHSFYYNHEMHNLTFVGRNKKTGAICIIYFNLAQTNYIPEIHEIDYDDIKNITSKNIYSKCIWKFSTCKRYIIFYVATCEKSCMVAWDCQERYIETCVKFKFTLLKEQKDKSIFANSSSSSLDEIYFPKMWFKYDRKGIILKNPITCSFICLNEKTPQEVVDKVLDSKYSQKECELISDPLFLGYNIYFLGECGIHQNKIVYIGNTDDISDKIDEIFDVKIHLYLPMFINDYEKFPNFKESFMVLPNKSYLMYFISYKSITDDYDEIYYNKCIYWNPYTMINSTINSYDILTSLKGSKLAVNDINHVFNDNLDNIHTDSTARFYLFKKALESQHEEIIKYIITSIVKGQCKFQLSLFPEGYISDLNHIDKNKYILPDILKNCSRSDVSEILLKYILKNPFCTSDAINTILICKECLYKRHRDVYIELINNLSLKMENSKYNVSRIDLAYMATTHDSLTDSGPNWGFQFEKYDRYKKLSIGTYILRPLIHIFFSRVLFFYGLYRAIIPIKSESNFISHLTASSHHKLKNKNQIISKFQSGNESIPSVLRWKDAAKIGESGLLYDLVSKGIEWETIHNEDIKILIDYKWKHFARDRLICSLIKHVILMFFFTCYCNFVRNHNYKEEDRLIYIRNLILTLSVSCLIVIPSLIGELIRYYKICIEKRRIYKISHLWTTSWTEAKTWINSYWNLIDLIIYISIIIVILPLSIVLIYTDESAGIIVLRSFAAITVCLIWFKALYYLFPFESTGTAIIMIFENFKDIIKLLGTLFFILFGFGTMFHVLFSGNEFNNNPKTNDNKYEEYDVFNSYGDSLLRTFVMMFGHFEIEWFTKTHVKILPIILFVIYMVAFPIVLLNLIIAHMADSFDRIKSKEELSLYVARCHVINNIESKMFKTAQEILNYKYMKEYFFILKPEKQAYVKKEWRGRVEEISLRNKMNVEDIINRSETKIETRIESLEKNLMEKHKKLEKKLKILCSRRRKYIK